VDAVSLFAPLLPEFVRVAQMPTLAADPARLHPQEATLIARAVDKRRREFAAGRQLAHALLAASGADLPALLPDADRVPRWPVGWFGCITHCTEQCAVALAPAARCGGVGIDLEPAVPIAEALHALVLRPAERARIEALPAPLRPLGALLVFSIKEAVYKAIYPRSRMFLEFEQVELAFADVHDVDAPGGDTAGGDAAAAQRGPWTAVDWRGGFRADVLVDGAAPDGLRRVDGRFRVHGGHVGAAVVLPPAG
jgi:4'-phosphopantetheinyl transferase EntD